MLPSEIVRIFAEEFATTPDAIYSSGTRNKRHTAHLRWAVAAYLAERRARVADTPGDLGYNHAARVLRMHHTSIMHGVKSLPRVLEDNPYFRKRVERAHAAIKAKELATRSCMS